MNQPRDFDIGVARRLAQLEKQLAYLQSIVVNPGLSRGTFMPIYLGSTIAGTFTYTSQLGFYVVIGDLVVFWGTVAISAFSAAPTGNMSISGLPFTSEATAGNISSVTFGSITNVDFSANAIQLIGDIPNNGTAIRLIEVFDNAANVLYPASQFDNNAAAGIRFAGFYQKA